VSLFMPVALVGRRSVTAVQIRPVSGPDECAAHEAFSHLWGFTASVARHGQVPAAECPRQRQHCGAGLSSQMRVEAAIGIVRSDRSRPSLALQLVCVQPFRTPNAQVSAAACGLTRYVQLGG
jgi:hypothetical protein